MTTTPADLTDLRPRRQILDRAFRGTTLLAGALILIILVLIAYTVTNKSLPVFRSEGLEFFTERRWAPNKEIYGALSFIYGTAITALLAVAISVPVSLGIALFTTQVAPLRMKKWLVSLTDLVAVVPSVVFGLWGIIFLAPKLLGVYKHVSGWFDGWPILGDVFGRTGAGRTFMTAGLILSVMITPIITSISREVIETCPQADRDGALALGATRWEMITGAVLPHSMSGIVGAVMLGLGRAMGETIAVALVIGSSPNITANLFSSGDSLPSVIAFQWGEATTEIKRSALIAMGLTLFLITIVINLLATAVV
ncbi:MAG TPA: phosphate ABC transporter permease subunit PstC, partial [Ilumatobacteraceae bacterium]